MVTDRPTRVGVLALQGDVTEHALALRGAGAIGLCIKTSAELESVDGLIVPGGESTTVMKLLERFGLCEPIRRRAADGMPLWGTCMGMIVMAREVVGTDQPTLGLLDVAVRRNAFGRQGDSDEMQLDVPALGEDRFPAIFIRAPWVEHAGATVEVMARRDGHAVMVRQGNLLGTSFHPELSGDLRAHRYFVDMVRGSVRIGKHPGDA